MSDNLPNTSTASIAKKIALTFDDGPNPPYTEQMLAILKEKQVPATFFVCGANVERHPDLVKAIHAHGHLIGNHTFFHHPLTTRLGLTFHEIMRTQSLIDRLVTQSLRLFRPPWGIAPFWLKRQLRTVGFTIVLYDIVGYDWEKQAAATAIKDNVVRRAKSEGIILLHDGKKTQKDADRSQTILALPQIIDVLRSQGFQFVPIPSIKSAKIT